MDFELSYDGNVIATFTDDEMLNIAELIGISARDFPSSGHLALLHKFDLVVHDVMCRIIERGASGV